MPKCPRSWKLSYFFKGVAPESGPEFLGARECAQSWEFGGISVPSNSWCLKSQEFWINRQKNPQLQWHRWCPSRSIDGTRTVTSRTIGRQLGTEKDRDQLEKRLNLIFNRKIFAACKFSHLIKLWKWKGGKGVAKNIAGGGKRGKKNSANLKIWRAPHFETEWEIGKKKVGKLQQENTGNYEGKSGKLREKKFQGQTDTIKKRERLKIKGRRTIID